MNKMKAPFSYYGGKGSLAPKLMDYIPHISNYDCYIEPFMGAMSVFWYKEKSRDNILNDLSGHVVNFYRVLQHKPLELLKEIKGAVHSELLNKMTKDVYNKGFEGFEGVSPSFDLVLCDVRKAFAFWFQCVSSYSNKAASGFAYDYLIDGQSGDANSARENFMKNYKSYRDKIKDAWIFNRDGVWVVEKYKHLENVFMFIDPPYPQTYTGHYDEMSQDNFDKMLFSLADAKCKFLVTCYEKNVNKEVAKLYNITKLDHTTAMKKSDGEILIYNYDLSVCKKKEPIQTSLF